MRNVKGNVISFKKFSEVTLIDLEILNTQYSNRNGRDDWVV